MPLLETNSFMTACQRILPQTSHATVGTQKDNNEMADHLKRGWMLTKI